MAFVLAKERGWPTPSFHICNDFSTLRSSLADETIDAFLWEHFTTSPYAKAGQLDIVGGIPTPWGCFCAVVDPSRIDSALYRDTLDRVLERSAEFERDEGGTAIEEVVSMSGMTTENAREWHQSVRYARVGASRTSFEKDLLCAQQTIVAAGVVQEVTVNNVREYCV